MYVTLNNGKKYDCVSGTSTHCICIPYDSNNIESILEDFNTQSLRYFIITDDKNNLGNTYVYNCDVTQITLSNSIAKIYLRQLTEDEANYIDLKNQVEEMYTMFLDYIESTTIGDLNLDSIEIDDLK